MKSSTSFVIGVLLGIAFSGMLLWQPSRKDPGQNTPLEVSQARATMRVPSETLSNPVYKYVGRMDILVENPAAVSYIFERGNALESVSAAQVTLLRSPSGQTNLDYFVKIGSTYYNLTPLQSSGK